MESCKFCGKALGVEPGAESWLAQGWCGAECAFRFYTFTKPVKAAQVEERNRAMEEILDGYRGFILQEAELPPDEETIQGKTRIVLEVIEGEIQRAYSDHGPLEILVIDHGNDEAVSIFGSMEIRLDPAFVAKTFRRAEES